MITFSVANSAPSGPSAVSIAASNTPGATTSITTALDGTSAQIALRPAPSNGTNVLGVDGIVDIINPPFAITAPSNVAAGSPFFFTVTALNPQNSTNTAYTGTVHFTSSDGQSVLPADYTYTSADAGVHVFSATLKTAGGQTLTVTDNSLSSNNAVSSAISIAPLAATNYSVTAPANATAGKVFNFTVTALDMFNNIATGYTGTVKFSTSDTLATPPVNATLSGGIGIFSATLKKAGSQTLTATDTGTSSIVGTSGPISVSPGAATSFSVTGSTTSVTAGTAVNFTVTALDAFSNIATGYSGTVAFATTDPLATPPSNSTLGNGVGLFTVTLEKAGNQTLIATDMRSSTLIGTSNPITVTAATATAFVVTGSPTSVMAGTAVGFTVTAVDTFGNIATSYTGTVRFTTTDTEATPPANSTLSNGTGSFTVTLNSAGSQTLSVTDVAHSSITGTSNAIVVIAASATHFEVNALTQINLNIPFALTIIAQDQFGNTATGYAGTVDFTCSDSVATLPANTALTNGAGIFSAILNTQGVQTVTAADSSNTAINGSAVITVVNSLGVTPFVESINRTNPAGPATNASTVTFTVTFSETVVGVNLSDFQLALTGQVAATLSQVTPVSGAVYTVTVTGITGVGNVGLNLVDNGTIHDLAGNPLTQPRRRLRSLSLLHKHLPLELGQLQLWLAI